MEEKKKEVLSEDEQRELLKQLKERIKQLRMAEYIDDDEEPDIFIGEGI
tara:strand:+ start:562 stop:708 length:147 start_codon:yes stop_codon:yes gene_type:complete